MLTVNVDKIRVCAGGNVTVTGGIFAPSCKIQIGGNQQAPIDVANDYVVFTAPQDPGEYSFTITSGGVSSPSIRLVVVEEKAANVYKLPKRGIDEFREMLIGMMPRGFGWKIEPGSNFYKMLDAVASGILMVYEILANLVKQLNPYTTDELAQFENEYGLPKVGLTKTTESGRRKEIIRIARMQGGCTVPHFKQILDSYGAEYEIYEYWKNSAVFPYWVRALGSEAYSYVFVKVYAGEFKKVFTCKSKCNESLDNERDKTLENLLNEDKPAHVRFVFGYVVRVITNESGAPLTDENGKILVY